MATEFPTDLDALTNPDPTDQMNVVPHAEQHQDANDGIEALQAKVGIDGSAVETSHDFLLTKTINAASALTDNAIIRGDGTVRGGQTSGVLIDDSDNVSGIVNLTLTGTVDGRDVDSDGTKLDGIESGATADQTTISGNAGTATALQTARDINGVPFDGTANITVTADANTLTGTELKSTVVTSALTSVGTIIAGVWNGTDVPVTAGGTGASTASDARTNLGLGDMAVQNASDVTITGGNADGLQFDNLDLETGGALRTGTTATNTALLQAFDVDGAAYTTFATLTAGNDPTFDMSLAVTFGGILPALLDGRAGGQILCGGTASGENLTLKSTADATRGMINIEDEIVQFTSNITFTAAPTLFEFGGLAARTHVLDFASASFTGLAMNPTWQYNQSASGFGAGTLFVSRSLFKNESGTVANLAAVYSFFDSVKYEADNASIDFGPLNVTYSAIYGPLFRTSNGGTLACGTYQAVRLNCTVTTGATITDRFGVSFADGFGAGGTITTQYGVHIANLSYATNNIGIFNASTTVQEPDTQSITAVGNTLNTDRSYQELDANADLTLTSTPTIADGFDGQTIEFMNVDATNTITLQDEGLLGSSNLDLVWMNQMTISPGESVTFRYSTAMGLWRAVGGTAMKPLEHIIMVASDETTALTVADDKVKIRTAYPFRLTDIKSNVSTAPTDATLIADVRAGGTSIMTTDKLDIASTETSTETGGATAPVLTTFDLTDDQELIGDIDQIGSTIAGAGLKITLIGHRI